MVRDVWTAGFQRKVTMKGTALVGEDINCRQANECMKKCDSYQAANRKKKKNSQRPEEIMHGRENE